LTEICQCDAWRGLFVRLVKLSKSLCTVVNPVVNNSSPEGHLPNDFGDIGQHLEGDGSMDDSLETTPQMVLLSAWRTVKEVSLLLGDMVFRSPTIRDYSNLDTTLPKKDGAVTGLLSSDQILDIFNFFTKLLSETKHRGAFEQAYIGFSRICIRLWGATDPVLHQLPFRWLRDLIKLISGELDDADSQLISLEKMCVTRRSAGVPYMIQALITSELQICASTGLHFCMTNLIGLCRTARTTEARTHALNILRALYRCTDLGETIGEYVADGLMAAITGYGATTWSERNSSTLLFSALMVRIFGVQRTKEPELNIRNKMTGRIFFLRYPQLFDFFLGELRVASTEVLADKKSLKLHPILLLLSRLYPSSLEGTESNLKLIEFLPIVSSCSGSAELQTRHLAAKFIEVIIAPHMIVDRISNILTSIVTVS
jgi:thyroid adenoma-associated protein